MVWQDRFQREFGELTVFEDGPLRVYFELFLNHYNKPLRATEIAELTQLNRSYVYDVLAQLVELELVTLLPHNPKQYMALDPTSFLEGKIASAESHLESLQAMKRFIQHDVMPKLEPPWNVKVTQMKQTYFLDSPETLIDYVKKALTQGKNRISIIAPSVFILHIMSNLKNVIEKMSNAAENLRIIVVGASDLQFPDKVSDSVIEAPELVNNFQIIIDDYVFLFNNYLDKDMSSGVGLMMIDQTIADAYISSLDQQFKQIIAIH